VRAVPLRHDPDDAAGAGGADVDTDRAVVVHQASDTERPAAVDRVDRCLNALGFPARQAVPLQGEAARASPQRGQQHARR
jgi:hypothetical protein